MRIEHTAFPGNSRRKDRGLRQEEGTGVGNAAASAGALESMMGELRMARERDDAASALEQARRLAASTGADGAMEPPQYQAVPVADPAADVEQENALYESFAASLPAGAGRREALAEYRRVREEVRLAGWREAMAGEGRARRRRLEQDLEGILARATGASDEAGFERALADCWLRLEPMQPWLGEKELEAYRQSLRSALVSRDSKNGNGEAGKKNCEKAGGGAKHDSVRLEQG